MQFFPKGLLVPFGLRTDEFLLEPLRTSHVELDYAALMDSTEMLRRWGQGRWPADDFTLEDNREDLAIHERQHLDGEAFTYTVLNPAKTACLGCVYIKALPPDVDHTETSDTRETGGDTYAAIVRFWVRQPRLADDLEQRLLAVLRKWFDTAWPFDLVFFSAAGIDNRQKELFSRAGLTLRHTIRSADRPAEWALYR